MLYLRGLVINPLPSHGVLVELLHVFQEFLVAVHTALGREPLEICAEEVECFPPSFLQKVAP